MKEICSLLISFTPNNLHTYQANDFEVRLKFSCIGQMMICVPLFTLSIFLMYLLLFRILIIYVRIYVIQAHDSHTHIYIYQLVFIKVYRPTNA